MPHFSVRFDHVHGVAGWIGALFLEWNILGSDPIDDSILFLFEYFGVVNVEDIGQRMVPADYCSFPELEFSSLEK